MIGFDPTQYVDPKLLAEAQQKVRNAGVEVRVGRGRNRGRFQVVFTAPEADSETWCSIDELNEGISQKVADYLYVVLAMKGKRYYVV